MQQSGKNQAQDNGSSESLDSLWRQALLIRDFAKDELDGARKRREEAEREAKEATEEYCSELTEEARQEPEAALTRRTKRASAVTARGVS
ncbi:MAG: hypothetical protein ACOC5K_02970 [Chloroflexota bacterium]